MRSRARWSVAVLAVAAVAAVLPGAGAAAQDVTTKTVGVVLTDARSDEPNPGAAGWGRVTSDPAGIDCPDDCTEDFAVGTTVRLHVAPTPGHKFSGWSVFDDAGADCPQADTCDLAITDTPSTEVDVALEPEAKLLVIPQGAGTLTFDPPEEGRTPDTCVTEVPVFDPLPAVCAPRYPKGTTVTVTAHPDPAVDGARFVRWSDFRCPPAPSCTVTVNGDRELTAFFSPVLLTVFEGTFGPITLDPPGLTCTFEVDCVAAYPLGTPVTVSRDPDAASPAPTDQWRDSCTGTGLTCTFRMRKNEWITAGRDPSIDIPARVPEHVELLYGGRRGGRIRAQSQFGGRLSRTCRRSCSVSGFRLNDRVTVRAVARGRARFRRWADSPTRRRARTIIVGNTAAVKAVFARRRR